MAAIPGIRRRSPRLRPRIVVVGDLVLDLVIAAEVPVVAGTDVPGFVRIRQGGSAASTARWIGRLGARATLVCAVGRDRPGRALVAAVEADGVAVRAARVAGVPTGRIAVIVERGGQRSFVTDRGAADRLAPADLRPSWFQGADAIHLPAYSLLPEPLGDAARAAIALARAQGAVVSLDLASVRPLLLRGRAAAETLIREIAPDLLLATDEEATALVGSRRPADLLELGGVVVLKRGRKGSTVFARSFEARAGIVRFDVATSPVASADTTGAGDAFDAGFLVAWLAPGAGNDASTSRLRRAAVAGNRAAARHLVAPARELTL